jgi:hypothetical protein
MSRRPLEYVSLTDCFFFPEPGRWGKGTCSRGILSALLAVLMTTAACGIVVVPQRTVLEEPFQEDQVKVVRHGMTTKKEVLEWFGPPLVVARPGSTVLMPEQELLNAMAVTVSSDTLFERFKPGSPPPQSPLLYYYEDQALSWTDFGAVCWFPTNGPAPSITGPTGNTFKVKKLWVLLDDATGLVVDHSVEVNVQELTGKQMNGIERKRARL